MSDRRGVVMVLFDLPVKTGEDRRNYTVFRKAMIRRGYGYFQRSVYLKLLRNISSGEQEMQWLDTHAPAEGSVQAVVMNLNVFRGLTPIRGQGFNMSLFADDVVFIGDDSAEYEQEMDDEILLELLERLKLKEDPPEAVEDKASGEGPEDGEIYQTDLFSLTKRDFRAKCRKSQSVFPTL